MVAGIALGIAAACKLHLFVLTDRRDLTEHQVTGHSAGKMMHDAVNIAGIDAACGERPLGVSKNNSAGMRDKCQNSRPLYQLMWYRELY